MGELDGVDDAEEDEVPEDEDLDLGEEGADLDQAFKVEETEMYPEQDNSLGDSDDVEDNGEDVPTVLQQMRENLPHTKPHAAPKVQDKLAAVLSRGRSIAVGDPAFRSSPGLRGPTGLIPINAMFTQRRERWHDERSKTLSPWSNNPSALETRRSQFSPDEGTHAASTRRSRQERPAERSARPLRDYEDGRERVRGKTEHVLAASGSSVIMNSRDTRPKASLAGIDELRSLNVAPAAPSKSSILGIKRAKKVAKKLPSLTGVPFGEYRGVQPGVAKHTQNEVHVGHFRRDLQGRTSDNDEKLLERVDDLIEQHVLNRHKSVWELDPVAVGPFDAATNRIAGSQAQKSSAPKPADLACDPNTTGSSLQTLPQPGARLTVPESTAKEFVGQAKEVLRRLQASLSKYPRSRGGHKRPLSPLLQPQKLILKARFTPAPAHPEPPNEMDVDGEPKTFTKARDSKLLLRAKFGKKIVHRTVKPTACNFACEGKVMIKLAAVVKRPATRTIFRWVKKPKQTQSMKLKNIRSRYSTPDLRIKAPGTTLNAYLLCSMGGVRVPKHLKYIKLHAMRINQVVASDLRQFTSLRFIDLTDNRVPMDSVASAIAIRKLCLQCNRMSSLNILPGTFFSLEVLDLSFNNLGSSAVVELAGLPALRRLNIDHNNIKQVPAAAGEQGAFPYLQTLSISGNKLESSSLSILSTISTLERLTIAHNKISRIPSEIDKQSFMRLAFMNLAYNHIVGTKELASLMKLRNLDKVLLFGNPLSTRACKDGGGKVLDIAKPILEDVEQAKVYGQKWVLEKPKPRKRAPQYSEKLAHPLMPDSNLEHPRVIPVEKLVTAINRMSERVFPDEHLSSGVTSRSMPFQEGMDEEITQVAFARTRTAPPAKKVAQPSEPPAKRDADALRELASYPSNFTEEEHIFDANAAFTILKQTLSTPVIETVFDLANYQKMTAAGEIRAREIRQKKQERIRAPVPTTPLVEELALKALDHEKDVVEKDLIDMNFRLSTLETTISVLLQELKPTTLQE